MEAFIMENKLYQTLIEQFSMYDLKDLQEILDDEESSEEAVKAAEYILSGKSVEREKYQSEVKKQEQLIKEKQDNISIPSPPSSSIFYCLDHVSPVDFKNASQKS